MDLLASASSAAAGPGVTQPISDLEALEQSIKSVTAMLDRVLGYVRSVLAGEVQGDPAVGRYLLDTFAASTDDLEKGGFNASLQVNESRAILPQTAHKPHEFRTHSWCRTWQTWYGRRPRFHPGLRSLQRPKIYVILCLCLYSHLHQE